MLFTYLAHEVSIVQGIKGLASGVFFDNLKNSFMEVSSFCYVVRNSQVFKQFTIIREDN